MIYTNPFSSETDPYWIKYCIKSIGNNKTSDRVVQVHQQTCAFSGVLI
jgi:hypothetical protein